MKNFTKMFVFVLLILPAFAHAEMSLLDSYNNLKISNADMFEKTEDFLQESINAQTESSKTATGKASVGLHIYFNKFLARRKMCNGVMINNEKVLIYEGGKGCFSSVHQEEIDEIELRYDYSFWGAKTTETVPLKNIKTSSGKHTIITFPKDHFKDYPKPQYFTDKKDIKVSKKSDIFMQCAYLVQAIPYGATTRTNCIGAPVFIEDNGKEFLLGFCTVESTGFWGNKITHENFNLVDKITAAEIEKYLK